MRLSLAAKSFLSQLQQVQCTCRVIVKKAGTVATTLTQHLTLLRNNIVQHPKAGFQLICAWNITSTCLQEEETIQK